MEIIFENETDYNDTAHLLELFSHITLKAFECEGVCEDVEISLIFTSDNRIRELNKKYRGIDKKTDVLSFPQFESIEDIKHKDSLGDIVISVEAAISQAKEYNHSEVREFCFLYCHSLLHLLGYDHMAKQDEIKMISKQTLILNEVGIKR